MINIYLGCFTVIHISSFRFVNLASSDPIMPPELISLCQMQSSRFIAASPFLHAKFIAESSHLMFLRLIGKSPLFESVQSCLIIKKAKAHNPPWSCNCTRSVSLLSEIVDALADKGSVEEETRISFCTVAAD